MYHISVKTFQGGVSFMDPFCYSCFYCQAVLSVHCSLVVACWEWEISWLLVGDVFLCFCQFLCGVLCQMWYSIVLNPDRCLLPYYVPQAVKVYYIYSRLSLTQLCMTITYHDLTARSRYFHLYIIAIPQCLSRQRLSQ